MRFFKAKSLDIRYIVGEILLIFIGITMALWFNNWNEARKEREIEQKTMVELRDAIRQDLADIEFNIQSFVNRVGVYEQLINSLEEDRTLADSLKQKIPWLMGYTYFLSNSGPYETLKSRGLETVTNDAIRLQIARYYDGEYERVQLADRSHFEHYRDYVKPQVLAHFEITNSFELHNAQALQVDPFDLIQVLAWGKIHDQFALNTYRKTQKVGASLLADIERTLGQTD